MKRVMQFAGLMLFALLVGALAAQTTTPGTLVVQGGFIASTGCLADLNDDQVLRKQGMCSFTVIALGLKVPDLACTSVVETYEDPTTSAVANDTVIDCSYKPVKTLPARPNLMPATRAGTLIVPESITQALSNGCLTYVNHPALRCGFNVNLQGLAVPNLTLTTTVSGGNTIIAGSYPPVSVTQ